ncbi:MAG: cupin domain-containing protein [bacterium]
MIRALETRWDRLDKALIAFMSTQGPRLLRMALGITFIWFGALKVAGLSPVADLVAQTVYWLPPAFFVPFLGWWEIVVGLGLLLGYALRLVLLLFWLQMAGTFLVLILRPELAFQSGNPLLLTVIGEFVVKNLVLIAAGLVVGSTVPRGKGPVDHGTQGTQRGEVFGPDDAVQRLPGPRDERSVEIFTHGTLQLKMYAPRGRDLQTPHTRDELYFVVSGRGLFFDGANRRSFGTGDAVFAPAGCIHRFEEFSDDLAVWVVFYGPEGGEGN